MSTIALPSREILLPRFEFPAWLRNLKDEAAARIVQQGGLDKILNPGNPALQIQSRSKVSSGWWLAGGISGANCVATYQPKGAASLAASYSNLNNPGTNDAAPGVAPTFASATGWTFNGTSQYLTTGVVAASTAWSMFFLFSGGSVAAVGRVLGGARTLAPSTFFNLTPNGGDSFHYYATGDNAFGVAGALASGVMGLAGKTGYLNGSSEGVVSTAGATPAIPLFVGARNTDSVASVFFAGNILAVAIYNVTLSAGQVAALTTAMNAL